MLGSRSREQRSREQIYTENAHPPLQGRHTRGSGARRGAAPSVWRRRTWLATRASSIAGKASSSTAGAAAGAAASAAAGAAEGAAEVTASAEGAASAGAAEGEGASDAGFFAVGVYNSKSADNVGTLWRSAFQLGAAYIFTIGALHTLTPRLSLSLTLAAYIFTIGARNIS